MDRRQFTSAMVVMGGALAASCTSAKSKSASFPSNFLWGAATAAYQVEGNNINSDIWQIERAPGTPYAEPAGDAANSFELWPLDLDLVRTMGLNSYRFSLEWARIEPRSGEISMAMLDHYKRMIEGCHTRGLKPFVTFNHFTTPLWFALAGGWANPTAPDKFARFCEIAARHLGDGIAFATTLNEPNLAGQLAEVMPATISQWLLPADKAVSSSIAKRFGVPLFVAGNGIWYPDPLLAQANLIKAHLAGRQAIKASHANLPVGVSLAIIDDQAVGATTMRDAARDKLYRPWLEAVRGDDFVGVQNYERALWGKEGRLPPPPVGDRNESGGEVFAGSLAGAVRYAYSVARIPVFVTEHGVNTPDDSVRQRLIPEALKALASAMRDGVPVHGYFHWSLIDNFEWGFGYKPRYGLHSLDRTTFKRTPKPSASILGAIARNNAV